MGLRLNDVGAHTAVDGTLAGDHGAVVRLAMDLAAEAAREAGDQRGRAARQAHVLFDWASGYLARRQDPGGSGVEDGHSIRAFLHVLRRPDQLAAAGSIDAHPHDGPSSLAALIDHDLGGGAPAAASIAGELGPLSRNGLRRLACDATVDLVSIERGRRDPLNVGRAARLVTPRLWRALVARDRGCVVNGCRRRPAQCAAHHVRHWADGGLTDLDNLVLLCHQHHHDHHDRRMDLPHANGRWMTQHGWSNAPP